MCQILTGFILVVVAFFTSANHHVFDTVRELIDVAIVTPNRKAIELT